MKKNESKEYEYSEDRLNQTKKDRRGLHTVMLVGLYLAILIVVMYVVSAVSMWLDDRMADSARDMAVAAGGQVLPEDQKVTMTQAELTNLLKENMLTASTEAAVVARAEVLDGIRMGLETGDSSMVEVLRPFYPDDIVVVSNGKFHFVPIDRNLKQNDYTMDNLEKLESGEFRYLQDGNVISHKGIDVSRFQGNIDWEAVAQDGVEFAFVRAAFRGYGTGKLVEDDKFEQNIKGAAAAGIHVGAYVYSQAISEEEIYEEANLVLGKLKAWNIQCPIVFDVEKTSDSEGRMNQLSLEERTNLALLFCVTVENEGYKPILYHNMEMGTLMLDLETLEGYDKWFAYYNGDMYYPYDYMIWQYSDKGSVEGIKGAVDVNISFRPFWEE